ncbi:glucosaminidase domain-containing protein [Vagococcus xieshaowenii]|nr:glucosaminidase domain-containing protein [Vagococcus xieshaowenii]
MKIKKIIVISLVIFAGLELTSFVKGMIQTKPLMADELDIVDSETMSNSYTTEEFMGNKNSEDDVISVLPDQSLEIIESSEEIPKDSSELIEETTDQVTTETTEMTETTEENIPESTTDSSQTLPEESQTTEETTTSDAQESTEETVSSTESEGSVTNTTTETSENSTETTETSKESPNKEDSSSSVDKGEQPVANQKPGKDNNPGKKPVNNLKPGKDEIKPHKEGNNQPVAASKTKQNNKQSTTDNRVSTKAATSGPSFNTQIDLGEQSEEFATSNLLNYRLPLLSELKSEQEAVLIYGSLLLVGKEQFEEPSTKDKKNEQHKKHEENKENKVKPTPITSRALMTWLGNEYFDQDLLTKQTKPLSASETIAVGDIVVWTNYMNQTQYGLYIGDDLLITVEKDGDDHYEVVTQYYVESDDQTIYRNEKLTLNKEGEKLLKQYPASLNFQTNPLTEKFVKSIGEGARELGLKYDVFASVMIAQALLESASGTSGLAQAPNHNLFGIKGQYQSQSVSMATNEDDGKGNLYAIQSAFRKYPSYQESLKDYVSLIKSGTGWQSDFYKEAWRSEANNYISAAQSLTGKYATDTQYDKKIISLIAAYDLTQYDEPKLDKTYTGTTSGILQSRNEIPKEYRRLMKFPDFNQKNYNTSGSYPIGQCTWYAFNRVAQLGMTVDDYMGNGGEWGTKGAKLGYKVSNTPKAGYLVSFLPGVAGSSSEYGHVAFVEAVTKDGILISEGNVLGGTRVSYRIISNDIARSTQVKYIEAK